MAKEKRRSNREQKKPKKTQTPGTQAVPLFAQRSDTSEKSLKSPKKAAP